MKNTTYNSFLGLLVAALVMVSCQNEYFQLDKLSDEMEIETDLVAPLVHGSLTIGDLVAWFDSSGYVNEFSDGLVYISYSDTMAEIMMDTFDLVMDGLYTQIYYEAEVGSDPIFLASSPGEAIHFRKSKFFGARLEGNNRLDSMLIKGGQLITDLASTFRHSGYLTLSSPYILDDNRNPYVHTVPISNASGNFTWSESRSLDGYFLEAEKQGDSMVFRMDYDLVLINSGDGVNPGDFCEINSSFQDMGFYSLFGFVDPQELVSESGDMQISIYADYPELSHLKLADPRINVAIESSLGIPFELTLDSVIATSDDNTSDTLEFYQGHPFIIPAPDINSVGETVYEEYAINNQTSNFQDLINLAPRTLSYRVSAGIGAQSQNHFILDTSRFMAEAEFLVPLDLSFTRYSLADTMDFSVGDEGIDTTIVKNVVVTIGTLNKLPIELALQVYFLDEFYNTFDSLFTSDPPLLAPSVVDADGKLVSASEKESRIDFPPEKLRGLDRSQFIRIEARMVTSGSGNQFVKFYSDYSLDIDISFYADILINTRDL